MSATERPDLVELREQWTALYTANTLHMLPAEALVASISDLAGEVRTRLDARTLSRFHTARFVVVIQILTQELLEGTAP